MASGSYLQIAGKQVVVPLPLKSFQLFGSTYAYYVDNLNSEAIRVSAIPSGIWLTLIFPPNEVSIVGACVAGGCPKLSGRVALCRSTSTPCALAQVSRYKCAL